MADTIKNIKRFEAAYDELKEKLWLVRNLSEQGIGYEKLAPHLQKDADKRMGIVKWINVPIFADDNEGERNEPTEGWKLVPVEPTEEMLAADFSVTMSMAVNAKHCRQLRYKAMLAAAPTPPAQEDEPDLYQIRMAEKGNVGAWVDVEKGRHDRLIGNGWEGRKLYTRPQSDRLRKAAEELIETRKNIGNFPIGLSLERAVNNLRAALERK